MKKSENNLLNYFSKEELNELVKENDLYIKASVLVEALFSDKVDKAGKPYIGHLYRVASSLDESIEKVAALLHDTLEDTDITYEDLFFLGFPEEVLEIVRLVTKKKLDKTNLSKEEKLKIYDEEIDLIINSGNIHAIRLKAADVSDNYDLNRLKELSIEKQEWFHLKYRKQLLKLNIVKGED